MSHYILRPNIAVPIRTIVAPSSMATSKSWLIPIESSRAETFGGQAAKRFRARALDGNEPRLRGCHRGRRYDGPYRDRDIWAKDVMRHFSSSVRQFVS